MKSGRNIQRDGGPSTSLTMPRSSCHGGVAFGVIVAFSLPFAQELVFLLSMAVICSMLFVVTREFNANTPARHPCSQPLSSLHSALRHPSEAATFGRHLTCSNLMRPSMAAFAKPRDHRRRRDLGLQQLTRYSVTKALFWLAVAGGILSLPNISLFFGLTIGPQTFGFGARRTP